jgi:hypothetical protein
MLPKSARNVYKNAAGYLIRPNAAKIVANIIVETSSK